MESDQKRSRPLNIALVGYGKMGKLIEMHARNNGHAIVTIIDTKKSVSSLKNINFDIGIDFSHPGVLLDHVELFGQIGKNLVVGTTGWDAHLPAVQKAVQRHGIGLLYSPNFSVGVTLFKMMVEQAARIMQQVEGYDVCGMEAHHRHKLDAPSGTAKHLEKILKTHLPKKDVSFSSIRCGHIPGTHTVAFDSPCDTITLTHTARSREGFAAGAVAAAEWLYKRQGLFTLDDMIRATKLN
jgi:4-hydroxy-tetrahydrodipicolinate reductase